MQAISIKAMLEAGVHFGHQTRRWNPKMSKYIYGHRNNIHIIDLQKSAKELKRALKFAEDATLQGKNFLFEGTKRQAQEAIRSEARRCGAYYANTRWIGGLLTNFGVVKKSVMRLTEMDQMIKEGILDVLSKKDGGKFTRELNTLRSKYEGVINITAPPDVLFVVDPTEEVTATTEARRTQIPVIALCDTDADPDLVTYPIPANDDAVRSIRFFTSMLAQCILDAKAKIKPAEPAQVQNLDQTDAAVELSGVASPSDVSLSVAQAVRPFDVATQKNKESESASGGSN